MPENDEILVDIEVETDVENEAIEGLEFVNPTYYSNFDDLSVAYLATLVACIFAYMLFVLLLRSVGGDD